MTFSPVPVCLAMNQGKVQFSVLEELVNRHMMADFFPVFHIRGELLKKPQNAILCFVSLVPIIVEKVWLGGVEILLGVMELSSLALFQQIGDIVSAVKNPVGHLRRLERLDAKGRGCPTAIP